MTVLTAPISESGFCPGISPPPGGTRRFSNRKNEPATSKKAIPTQDDITPCYNYITWLYIPRSEAAYITLSNASYCKEIGWILAELFKVISPPLLCHFF